MELCTIIAPSLVILSKILYTINANSDFLINQNQLAPAVKEKYDSVEAYFDPRLDDDVEADLLNRRARQQNSQACKKGKNYLICVVSFNNFH